MGPGDWDRAGVLVGAGHAVRLVLFSPPPAGSERSQRLCRDFQRGGDGRSGVQSLSGRHAWLHWVVANFPADTMHRSNNFTREEALQELDTRIASNGNYLLLQRMGVMAPLLGVVLTVAGFFWLNVGGEDQSLQNILLAVTPLGQRRGHGRRAGADQSIAFAHRRAACRILADDGPRAGSTPWFGAAALPKLAAAARPPYSPWSIWSGRRLPTFIA